MKRGFWPITDAIFWLQAAPPHERHLTRFSNPNATAPAEPLAALALRVVALALLAIPRVGDIDMDETS